MPHTLEMLKEALLDVVASGRIGTPVSMRMSIQMTAPAYEIEHAAFALELASSVFPMQGGRFHIHRSRLGSQCSLLFICDSGETLSITAGTHAGAMSLLSLVLVGNHGVARLEGNLEPVCKRENMDAELQAWLQRLQKEIKLTSM